MEQLEDNTELTHYYSLKIINEIDNIVNQTNLTGSYMMVHRQIILVVKNLSKIIRLFGYFINSNNRIGALLDKAQKWSHFQP